MPSRGKSSGVTLSTNSEPPGRRGANAVSQAKPRKMSAIRLALAPICSVFRVRSIEGARRARRIVGTGVGAQPLRAQLQRSLSKPLTERPAELLFFLGDGALPAHARRMARSVGRARGRG